MPSKPWFLSRTILSAIVQFVLALVLICSHHDLRDMQDRIVNALQTLATGIVAIVSLYGTISGRFNREAGRAPLLASPTPHPADRTEIMTTSSTNTNPVVRFFSNDIVNPLKSFFGSEVGETVTEFIATGAGIASSLALIEELQPTNKQGVAQDIFALSSVAYSLLSGQTPPTLAQIQGAFGALKSDAKTSSFEQLATTLSAALYNYIAKYSNSPWISVATWYVYGWQLTAQVMGGAGTGTPSTLLPSTAATVPAAPNPANRRLRPHVRLRLLVLQRDCVGHLRRLPVVPGQAGAEQQPRDEGQRRGRARRGDGGEGGDGFPARGPNRL